MLQENQFSLNDEGEKVVVADLDSHLMVWTEEEDEE